MAVITDKISCVRHNELACVKIPFREKYSMLIIYSDDGLPIDKINFDTYKKILSLFARPGCGIRGEIKLIVPKFSIISINNKLRDVLTNLGLPKSYSGRIANTAISQYEERILSLSAFEMDEKGVRASSSIMRISTIGDNPYEILIDSPFCFFIIENSTSAILFQGILLNPAAE